jgi:serine/threonine protein kinase
VLNPYYRIGQAALVNRHPDALTCACYCVQLKRYSEKTAAAVFRQILHAVNFLHERKIVHRDIKPDNVVFKTTIKNSSDFSKDSVRLSSLKRGTCL